jgi:thiosulfate/3-mercaptopyruvate sulfurtransferase
MEDPMPASTTAADPLVDMSWLADHLDDPDIRPVEVDVSAAAYDLGHVPGAVLWNAYGDLRHPDYEPVGTPELERLLGRCGVTPETTLVFYGYAAHLGYWLVKAYGHTRAVVIDEPREAWRGPWSSEAPAPGPVTHRLSRAPGLVAKERLLGLDGVVLDVRAEAEFTGEIFWPSGAPEEHGRAGHVPGAVSLPISELRTDTGFRPAPVMLEALSGHGISPATRVTTYCTIGNRASQAWYALTHLLGFREVSVYYGGWAEWGTDPAMPVERGRVGPGIAKL